MKEKKIKLATFLTNKEYSILYAFCGVVHTIYALMFLCIGIDFFVQYNILSSLFFLALAIMVSYTNKVELCAMMCIFEIISFSIIGTLLIGYQTGFLFFIVTIIPLTAYVLYSFNLNLKKIIFYIEIESAIFFTTSVLSMLGTFQKFPLEEVWNKRFFFLNIVCSFIILGLFFVFFIIQIRMNEKYLIEQNEDLKNAANYDSLTSLLNRRTFDYYFEKHIKAVREKGKDFCIIMADIDDFKIFNDTFGHDIGDEVLKVVANSFKKNTRETDQIFRWGGEEILGLLSLSETDAKIVAERIRKDIEKIDTCPSKITISVGISSYQVMDTEDSMVKKADDALYFSKKNGKNQSNIYGRCIVSRNSENILNSH